MLKVVVDRKLWQRGSMFGSTLLNSKTGLMCCVGFACLAAGLTKGQIKGHTTIAWLVNNTLGLDLPESLRLFLLKSKGRGACKDSSQALQIYQANDSEDLPADDPEREETIHDIGLKLGVEFTFKG